MVHTGQLPLPVLIERLTTNPGCFLGRGLGTLKVGSTADVTVFDPDLEWTVDPSSFASKGKNTPLAGVMFRGKVMMTIVGGDVRYDRVDYSKNESGTVDRQ
jgi:dihydroorotase